MIITLPIIVLEHLYIAILLIYWTKSRKPPTVHRNIVFSEWQNQQVSLSNEKLACNIQEQMSIKNCDNLAKTRFIFVKIYIQFQPKLN